jgi:hypothetical protein
MTGIPLDPEADFGTWTCAFIQSLESREYKSFIPSYCRLIHSLLDPIHHQHLPGVLSDQTSLFLSNFVPSIVGLVINLPCSHSSDPAIL